MAISVKFDGAGLMMSLVQQVSLDVLNKQIASLTAERDALLKRMGNAKVPAQKTAAKKSASPSNARSIAQRKRWAEQKRKQREAAKASKAAKK